MVDAATKEKTREFEYRRIRGDYGKDDDIGLVAIRNNHLSRNHHWVRFPNGVLRQWYLFEVIDEARFDEMEAFEMAPKLKVSYRPISRFLDSVHEIFITLTAIILLWIMVIGFIEVVGAYYFDWALSSSVIGNWILSKSFMIFWGFLALSFIGYFGNLRYHQEPKADHYPKKWEHERIEFMRRNNPDWS